MYNYKDINVMHLEPSSLCNAECPVCNRRLSGGPKNPIMTERCITLDEFKEWFPVDFLQNLEIIILCGNYGDPMVSPNLIEILSYFREVNPIGQVQMNTNAGGRDKKFWQDMAKVIGKYGRVVFSVDGLEDTNHLYRKGVSWEKVWNAMTTFTSTKKANATWEFLVFDHNQHQIAEARQLAESMGMEFIAKKAMGFQMFGSGSIKEEISVLDHDGRLDYTIYAPDDEWKNESLRKSDLRVDARDYSWKDKGEILQDITNLNLATSQEELFDNLDVKSVKKLDDCEISCASLPSSPTAFWQTKDQSTIYVDSTGLVFPCCFTGSKYYAATGSFETNQLREFIHSYGEDMIRLSKDNNIENIIYSDIMQKGFVKRWNTSTTKEGKLFTCSTFCGKGINDEIMSTKKSIAGIS